MYEKTLSRYIGANQSAVREDEAEEKGLKGLEGVEPEVGLINWAEELVGRVFASSSTCVLADPTSVDG